MTSWDSHVGDKRSLTASELSWGSWLGWLWADIGWDAGSAPTPRKLVSGVISRLPWPPFSLPALRCTPPRPPPTLLCFRQPPSFQRLCPQPHYGSFYNFPFCLYHLHKHFNYWNTTSLRFWMCFPAKSHIHIASSVVFNCRMLFLIPVRQWGLIGQCIHRASEMSSMPGPSRQSGFRTSCPHSLKYFLLLDGWLHSDFPFRKWF